MRKRRSWLGIGRAIDRVFVGCARGLAVSTDQSHACVVTDSHPGGHRLESTVHADGLHARCGDTVLVSASTGPSGRYAAVYRGGLDGRNLKRCRRGLREWFDNNIDTHCVDASPDGRFAAFATSSGHVFASDDQGATWNELA